MWEGEKEGTHMRWGDGSTEGVACTEVQISCNWQASNAKALVGGGQGYLGGGSDRVGVYMRGKRS